MKIRYKFLIGIIGILLIISAGLSIWLLNPYEPMNDALEVMNTSNAVKVTDEGWYVFEPSDHKVETSFIFYPGGRVKAEAYIPLAYNIAKSGYKVIIIPMPVNLAVFGINKADRVINKYQDINHWVIGGHSLGGSMAARYANNNPSKISGLILLASYPAESDDLSNSDIDALSIYARKDGFVTIDKINNTKELLPENTIWKEIKGGNHSQFGYYGFQKGDIKADISREEQHDEVVKIISEFLSNIWSLKENGETFTQTIIYYSLLTTLQY